eukprot:s357_g27.t1
MVQVLDSGDKGILPVLDGGCGKNGTVSREDLIGSKSAGGILQATTDLVSPFLILEMWGGKWNFIIRGRGTGRIRSRKPREASRQGGLNGEQVSVNEVEGKSDGDACVEWNGGGSDGVVDELANDETDDVVGCDVEREIACLPHSGQVEVSDWWRGSGGGVGSVEDEVVIE